MERYANIVLLAISCFRTSGQEKKDLAIRFGVGIFTSPYYDRADAKAFYRFGLDYHLGKRHVLSAGYFAGNHAYYDHTLSNTPLSMYSVHPGGTNATASYHIFSLSYKYDILNLPKLSILPGAGAGIMTHSQTYAYTYGSTVTFQTSTWSDLVFPVTLDIHFKPSRHWQFGLAGGFYVQPDYPILALHAGPVISYVFK